MTKLPLAPIKRIAVEGGAQRIGIPAADTISEAAGEWIKRVTIAAQKYAIHAGRKTIKPEDVIIVVKDMGINIPLNQKPKAKQKKTVSHQKPAVTPVQPPIVQPAPPAPAKPVQHGSILSPPASGAVQATLKAHEQTIRKTL